MERNKLHFLNASVFLQSQIFMLPVLLLFYQHNGLTIGDFFLFQGIFSLTCLFLEIPMGYLGDIFPKKNVLIFSYSCFVVRLLLWLFWAHLGYWIILAGEILYALQKSSFTGTSDSYVYEYLQKQKASKEMLTHYGKMNFFMSIGTAFSSLVGAWFYHLVSVWSIEHYQYDYGFVVLIVMELLLNTVALFFLFMLPKLPCSCQTETSLYAVFKRFFDLLMQTVKNKFLRYHIIYAGLLAATTMVFVWSFQPMMKIMALPVSLYGLVYFINHLCRAGASFSLDKIMKYISLAKLSIFVFVSFAGIFILTPFILELQPLPTFVNISYFCVLSLLIGMQLAFNLSNTNRLHHLVSSSGRSTVSSINTASGRFFSGLFLILLKFLVDDLSTQTSLIVCFGIFLVALIPLRYVYRISSKE